MKSAAVVLALALAPVTLALPAGGWFPANLMKRGGEHEHKPSPVWTPAPHPTHPAPKPEECPEHMRYNPSTKKCYNPARHPSEDNCHWLGKVYNKHSNTCEDAHKQEHKSEDCPHGMRYNPKTKKCYSPERHPSEDNCKYLGKVYNKHHNTCEDVKKPEPVPQKPVPQKPVCKHGEYFDEHEHVCKPVHKPAPKPAPVPQKPVCKHGEYFDEHEHVCKPVHKPAPKPQKPVCKEGEYFDTHEHKCVKKVVVVPTPQKPSKECKHGYYYSEHQKGCVMAEKPKAPEQPKQEKPKEQPKTPEKPKEQPKAPEKPKEQPKPKPAPVPSAKCGKGSFYDEKQMCCVSGNGPAPHDTQCPGDMRYNPKTHKCFNCWKHPSADNCNYLGMDYNKEHGCVARQCIGKKAPAPAPAPVKPHEKPAPAPVKPAPKPAPVKVVCKHGEYFDEHEHVCKPVQKPVVKCPEHMIFNPKSGKCYNPARHPDEYNCAFLGKKFDAHSKTCVDEKKHHYEPKPQEPKKEEPKKDEHKPEEPKKEEPKKDEHKPEEPKKEEPKH